MNENWMFQRIQRKDLHRDLQELCDLVGLENVQKIVKYYGGSSLYIPRIQRLPTIERVVRELAEQGKAIGEIRRIVQLSERKVRALLKQKEVKSER